MKPLSYFAGNPTMNSRDITNLGASTEAKYEGNSGRRRQDTLIQSCFIGQQRTVNGGVDGMYYYGTGQQHCHHQYVDFLLRNWSSVERLRTMLRNDRTYKNERISGGIGYGQK
ncbi:unnamed protein product [Linum trigynum]|uniref:Uncharacterized protein n=1 Tax=Linum trigynum TaxID=586398 RepID=A0AAV2EFQ5_9ROSI